MDISQRVVAFSFLTPLPCIRYDEALRLVPASDSATDANRLHVSLSRERDAAASRKQDDLHRIVLVLMEKARLLLRAGDTDGATLAIRQVRSRPVSKRLGCSAGRSAWGHINHRRLKPTFNILLKTSV
jgi:hypothetical protein